MQEGFFSFNSGPLFDDAVKLDRYLFEMAAYDVTNGFIPSITCPEDIHNLQEETAKRFNYFKKQIRSGETTISDLSKFIALKNGPFKNKKLTDEQMIENVMEEGRKPIIDPMSKDMAIGILKKVFGEMAGNGITLTTADKLFPQIKTGEERTEDTELSNDVKPKKKKKGGLGKGL